MEKDQLATTQTGNVINKSTSEVVTQSQQEQEPKLEGQAKEDRNHVTPFAFGVSESLLGTPLATPQQRLWALLMDSVLIVTMTQLNDLILVMLFAWMFFKAANDLKRKGKFGITRKILRVLGGFCVLVILGSALDQWDDNKNGYYRSQDHQSDAKPDIHSDQNGQAMASDSESSFTINQDKIPPEIASDVTEVDKVSIDEVADALSEAAKKDIHIDDSDGSEKPSLMDWIDGTMKDMGIHLGWAAFYFSVFTAWLGGQTPGKRLFGIKVVKLNGNPPNLWESFQRYGGYGAGLATGLMGFLQVYWDPNRQAVQDKISETLVIKT